MCTSFADNSTFHRYRFKDASYNLKVTGLVYLAVAACTFDDIYENVGQWITRHLST